MKNSVFTPPNFWIFGANHENLDKVQKVVNVQYEDLNGQREARCLQ